MDRCVIAHANCGIDGWGEGDATVMRAPTGDDDDGFSKVSDRASFSLYCLCC